MSESDTMFNERVQLMLFTNSSYDNRTITSTLKMQILIAMPETSRQIHLPSKQRLINRRRHRHTTNESMDSYR